MGDTAASGQQDEPKAFSQGSAANSVEFTWNSPDGLTLSGRDWPAANGLKPGTNVVCLPGLSRNVRDFNDIAMFLQARGYRVIALDYRGRGKSEWDEDWRNYTLSVEEADIATAIDHLGLDRFTVLGTSRGGLHALVMANRYPATRMTRVILNDVGPNIEMRALQRIAATLGRNMQCQSLDEVADNVSQSLENQFPSFGRDHWLKLATQLASEHCGRITMDYDPALARQLSDLDHTAPSPDLWPLYQQLTDRPLLILRGEHSDLLSRETCQKMLEYHPRAQLKIIPGQGHAPVLWEAETHEAILCFLENT